MRTRTILARWSLGTVAEEASAQAALLLRNTISSWLQFFLGRLGSGVQRRVVQLSKFQFVSTFYEAAAATAAALAPAESIMQENVVDESEGPYFPFNRREPYPKRLKVDFRRLPVRFCIESRILWVFLAAYIYAQGLSIHRVSKLEAARLPRALVGPCSVLLLLLLHLILPRPVPL